MKAYDPQNRPEPAAWLAIDEYARLDLVESYHQRTRVRLPNLRVHAVLHVAVENQMAENDPVVAATVERLLKQGLSRHEAIHAIAAELLTYLNDLARDGGRVQEGSADARPYYEALQKLTPDTWRASAFENEEQP